MLSTQLSHYFVGRFTVADASVYDHAVVFLHRDDGAAVDDDGVEVGRSNLPDGALSSATLARDVVGFTAEDVWEPIVVPRRLLVSGVNVLAIELHQASAVSSDAVLDVRVEGKR